MAGNHRTRFQRRLQNIQSFQARFTRHRNRRQKFADVVTAFSGTVEFLIVHAAWFGLWIAWNIGVIPGLKPFDPFPFVLLTTVVSIEAIFLAIIVLVSQNRQSKIADLRQEVDLQINMIAEGEVTKLIQLVAGLYRHLKIHVGEDSELKEMLKPTDPEEIERRLEEQLRREEGAL